MKTIDQMLETVIVHDPTLRGFKPDDLPDAAKARVQNTLVSIERYFTHEELDQLQRWASDKPAAQAEFSDGHGCTYYVFADGSLYFSSTGDSEVWAFATDFASERILNGYDGKLDRMDTELLAHLGGFYADAAADRNI